MARIQITDLNSSDSELSYELSEQELQSVVGGGVGYLSPPWAIHRQPPHENFS